ncbi:inositol monophosphatase family protein [uncultured Microbacterium sp.]|uniref:inositol monophosphatase family protein n=1 Tax=uncultured Microbacterium sp. TaxID=191216 RepID=UPI0035CBEB6B
MTETDLIATDTRLLGAAAAAVRAATDHMHERFAMQPRPVSRDDVVESIRAGDAESLSVLRPLLEAAYPAARWVEDELDDGSLPRGDWWVTDPVEGAINFVHGISEWAVTATLVRDNEPVLAVVALPGGSATYTAVRGGGAFLNGRPIRVSAKTRLSAALVGTGQASPRETADTFALIARTLPVMMAASGVTRVSVPPTLQLIHVAAGRMDAFWQHSAVRSGLLPGALLVEEAGGTVTDIHGAPWSLASTDFLATAPGVHGEAVSALTSALTPIS